MKKKKDTFRGFVWNNDLDNVISRVFYYLQSIDTFIYIYIYINRVIYFVGKYDVAFKCVHAADYYDEIKLILCL